MLYGKISSEVNCEIHKPNGGDPKNINIIFDIKFVNPLVRQYKIYF